MKTVVIDRGERMEQPKKQAIERNFRVIHFPEKEKTKLEIKLERSVSDLVDAMRELAEVEQMTGRNGLPERVYISFTSVIMDAVRLAKAKGRKRGPLE